MKKLSVLSIFALCAFSLFAQTLPNKCMVSKPSVLVTKMLRDADVNRLLSSPDYCQSESRNKMFWIVYSDRDNNVAYTSSTGTTQACTLSMNEKLRIAQIENNRALVYEEPVASTTYPKISSAAICKGWVPMDRLLLWDICMADEMGVYQKALLCLNADVESQDRGYGYLNPSVLENKIPLDPTFKFYYVMKRAKASNGKNLVLLATQSSMSGFSDANLYAWVPEDMYVSWNQRSCIEPTWNKDDIRFFSNNSYIATIHDVDGTAASKWKFAVKKTDPYPDDDDDFYRWPGEVMRYPILDATTDKYYCTELMGNIGAGWVDSAKIRREEFYANRRHVNILIVMEASEYMEKYADAISQAIRSSCMFYDHKYGVRVGVMLYRSKEDGEYETEYCHFGYMEDPILHDFIQRGGRYGYVNSLDGNPCCSSLHYGMQSALERFRNPAESNVMVVIGDRGNDGIDNSAFNDSIVAKIVEKNVDVAAFQVRNLEKPSWTQFNVDLVSIIRNSLQLKYDNIQKGTKVIVLPRNDYSGFVFSNNLDQNSLLFLAEHRHALSGKEMDAEFLKKIMTEVIGGYAQKLDNVLDIVHKGNIPSDKWPLYDEWHLSGHELVYNWYKRYFGKSNVTGLLGFTGFTDKKAYDRDVWKVNVMLTDDELSNLIMRLSPLYAASCGIDYSKLTRKLYVEWIKDIVSTIFSIPLSENMDLDQCVERLNSLYPVAIHRPLHVLDSNIINEEQFKVLLLDVKLAYERLLTHRMSYKYSMQLNGQTYYWIPLDEICM
mgnify:FL=1